MNITVTKKYLIFPVNISADMRRVCMNINGETVYALNLAIDNENPKFNAYIDVSRFMGNELSISVSPETELSVRESDTMDIEGLYSEELRPQAHFSTKNGWNNDPNGLVYLDGTYHMFYQHNPGSPKWENMHWDTPKVRTSYTGKKRIWHSIPIIREQCSREALSSIIRIRSDFRRESFLRAFCSIPQQPPSVREWHIRQTASKL